MNNVNANTNPNPPIIAAPQALVHVDTSTQVLALVPNTLEAAMKLAEWLAQSSLMPKSVNKAFDIFFVITAGMEVGIPPMAALRSLYCVNGRTALESKAKMSLCLSKGAAQYFKRVEYTPEATTWETLRRGKTEPVRMRYTLKEAIAAFLAPGPNPDGKGPPIAGKEGPWRQYPQRMISHRALGWLCDDEYPDVVLGIATAEDFDASEMTFVPIGAGVELGSPRAAAAAAKPAQTEVIQHAPPAHAAAEPPSATPAPAAAAPPKEQPKGPAISEADVVSIVTAIGKTMSEKALREVARTRINTVTPTPEQYKTLHDAYEDQLVLIRAAAEQESKS